MPSTDLGAGDTEEQGGQGPCSQGAPSATRTDIAVTQTRFRKEGNETEKVKVAGGFGLGGLGRSPHGGGMSAESAVMRRN